MLNIAHSQTKCRQPDRLEARSLNGELQPNYLSGRILLCGSFKTNVERSETWSTPFKIASKAMGTLLFSQEALWVMHLRENSFDPN